MELHAHIDGGARGNPGPAAIGVVIHDDKGNLLYEEGTYIGHGTNNEAEYRALIRLLEVCATDPVIKDSGANILRVACDSQLIVNQVLGEWKIKEERLRLLLLEVREARKQVTFEMRIGYVPREQNKEADRLVNKALDNDTGDRIAIDANKNRPRKKVFVVYGRDEEAKRDIELLLFKLKLEPVFLDQCPRKGRTLIELLENYLPSADFVCVLLTPDDKGGLAIEDESAYSPRARQNTILELGWAIGNLGRERVAILRKETVDGPFEDPSDLRGLVYFPFKKSVLEVAHALAVEFENAKLEIDWTGIKSTNL